MGVIGEGAAAAIAGVALMTCFYFGSWSVKRLRKNGQSWTRSLGISFFCIGAGLTSLEAFSGSHTAQSLVYEMFSKGFALGFWGLVIGFVVDWRSRRKKRDL
jgi:putative effector of murein hydrolase LrgA (UPF0299 family)